MFPISSRLIKTGTRLKMIFQNETFLITNFIIRSTIDQILADHFIDNEETNSQIFP